MAHALLEKLFSLDGKVAFITGGYRGIGLTMAETYAAAGANVVLAARNLEGCRAAAGKIARTYGVKAAAKALDVHNSKLVDSVVKAVAEEFGTIDILVNCAGISGSEKPVLKMTDEDLDDVMNVDFRGTFLVSRAAGQIMAQKKSGRIINVASILGKIATRNMAGYCASKAAVLQLTKVMALELMRDNVQVNALCPGYILTDINKDFFASEAGQKMIKKMIPINRVGELCELQSISLFLATCPPFMTGGEFYMDGGHTIV
ncbi:MAG: SDR family oxidoreductase [Candidatus Korobacteraceae bacterium]|jgi:NAD(P)-dependent dehydrogenase (short-subunit alcohol dehydrogenase family)